MINEELRAKLFEAGFTKEDNYGGCAQCTLAALNDHLIPISDDIFTAATALAGGCAATGNVCGACSGGVLAIGTVIGRDYANIGTEEGLAAKAQATNIARNFVAKFEAEFGSHLCSGIQESIFGKSYKMYVPEEKEEFLANGGHGENGCTRVCGKAAQWVYEVLDEAGLLAK